MTGVLFVLIGTGGLVLLFALFEQKQDERRKRQRVEEKRRATAVERDLRERVRMNNYPSKPDLHVEELTQNQSKDDLSRTRQAPAKAIATTKKFAAKEPSLLWTPSIYDDFDSLNRPHLRGTRFTREGEFDRFPYETIDLTGSSTMWTSSTQIDSDIPSKIYLIQNPKLKALKVGITSLASSTDRIAQHQRQGWSLVRSWTTDSGRTARNVESSVLQWWRAELHAPTATGAEQMPQGGYTETIETGVVTPLECVDRISSMLTESGAERVYPADQREPSRGFLIDGPVTIHARVRWSRWKKGRGGSKVWHEQIAEKLLVISGENEYVLEIARQAYGHTLPSTGGVGDTIRIRGRLQVLGVCLRITNPWIYSPYSSRITKPSSKFDFC